MLLIFIISDANSVSIDAEGGGPQPLDLESTRNLCRKLLEISEQFTFKLDGIDVVFLNWLVIGCGFCEEAFITVKYINSSNGNYSIFISQFLYNY
jgi:hypothetical protein